MQKICYFKKYVGIEFYVYHLRYIQFTENIEIVITVGVEKCFSVEHIYKIGETVRETLAKRDWDEGI